MPLGKSISETRKLQGLSQEALAELAQVSLSTIQRIEKGTVNPRPHTFKLLVDTLSLNPQDFATQTLSPDNIEDTSSLKQMCLSTLVLGIVPFLNILAPLLVWKLKKRVQSQADAAGKILSFQVLWIIFAALLFFSTLFISNLVTGMAGKGLYMAMLTYLLSVAINMVTTLKALSIIKKGKQHILPHVPNLF